ncbi:MAG: hypothetical protein BGN88_06745 [Clostridiales bacterium 43-6]|nr:MAG: hypothetical protein BGN88_06745 [Clostridiales bacterium 43-6]
MVDEKVSKFVAAITEDANQKRDQITRETEEHIKTELAKAEEAARSESELLILRKTEAIRAQVGRELSHKELESRKTLFNRREEIADEVFLTLKEKVLAFTKTGEYKDYLLRSATELSQKFDGQAVTVLIKQDDVLYQDDIIKLFAPGSTVQADQNILLGGVKAKTEVIAADNTLDSKLKDQKEWFGENCGMKFSGN